MAFSGLYGTPVIPQGDRVTGLELPNAATGLVRTQELII